MLRGPSDADLEVLFAALHGECDARASGAADTGLFMSKQNQSSTASLKSFSFGYSSFLMSHRYSHSFQNAQAIFSTLRSLECRTELLKVTKGLTTA